MINKLKKNLNKITVGKILLVNLLILPMKFIFPDNIICGYASEIALYFIIMAFMSKFHLFAIWLLHLILLMSTRGTTERAEKYIFNLIAEHLKSGKEMFFGRSK